MTLTNVTADYGSLVVVGPRSRDVLGRITSTPLDNASFPWLSVRRHRHRGRSGARSARELRRRARLGAARRQQPAGRLVRRRSGQPGEQHGIRDFGIYAVDSLRLDKCYRGWKADLEIGFSPFDASLDRFVDLTKPDFVGKAALVAEQRPVLAWRFVPMTLDEAGEADAPFCSSIFDGDGPTPNASASSPPAGGASRSARASRSGYVRPGFEAEGTKVHIKILGQMKPGTVGREPLYDPDNLRLRG